MGRAIDQDNKIIELTSSRDNHERRLKLIEDALEEIVHTRVHHVDLHDMDKEYIGKLKEEELKDEEFTPPAGKRKKTTKRKTVVIEKDNAEA